MQKAFITLIFCVILFSPRVRPFSGARVLEISTSGHSVMLDRGSLDGIKEGDIARFIIQSGEISNPNLSNAVKAEAIRVTEINSFWFFKKVGKKNWFKKKMKILMALAPDLMEGRRSFNVLSKKIYISKEKEGSALLREQQDKDDFPDDLVWLEKTYNAELDLESTEVPKEADLKSSEIMPSEESEIYLDEYGAKIATKKIDLNRQKLKGKQHREVEREAVVDQMVRGTIEKYNSNKKGLEGFYQEQKRDKHYKELRDKSVMKSLYDQYLDYKIKKKFIHPRVYKRMEVEGDFWVADMDDIQLRRYFIQSGLQQEEERKRLALINLPSHEFLMRFSWGLDTNTSGSDPNFRSPGKTGFIAYEWHLMKTSQILTNWSIEAGLEYGVGHYDAGGINVQASEVGTKFVFNYYFDNLPSTVERFVWYFGSGIKLGIATFNAPSLSSSPTYSVISFPHAHLGVKYRWRAGDENDEFLNVGLGWNAILSAENMSFSSSEEISSLKGKFSTMDYKLSLGIGVFF